MLGTAISLSAYISACTRFVGITLLPLNIFYVYSCVLLHDLCYMTCLQCNEACSLKKVRQSVTIQKVDSELGVGEVSVEDWHTCMLQIFVICIVQVLW